MMGLWHFSNICFWMFQLKLYCSCTLNTDKYREWLGSQASRIKVGRLSKCVGRYWGLCCVKEDFFFLWLFSSWTSGSHGLNHDFLWNGKAQAPEWIFFFFFLNASLGGDAWWEGNAFQFPWNKGNKAGIAARIVLYFQSIVCQCFNNTHFVFLKHLTAFLLEEVEVIGFVFFLERLHNEVSRLV